MADKEYRITMAQGQFLMNISAAADIPEKLGDNTFTSTDRAIIQGMLAGLFTKLKSYSPFVQEYEPGKKSKMFFGAKDNWEESKAAGGWVMLDPKKVVPVRLSKEELNGAAWACYITLVPRAGSGTAVSPSEAAETVWPLLRVLGKYNAVGDQLGLKKIDEKKHGWNDDPTEAAPVAELPASERFKALPMPEDEHTHDAPEK